jgi:hypothetical protein
VSFVACEIALSKGRWNYSPSPERVRRKLESLFEDSLLAVTFRDLSDDNAIEVEVRVDVWETCEWVCDTIFRAFLKWNPEYESMIEVEILREPEGPFDDPFEYVPDDFDWDGWDDWFDRIVQIWH